MQEELDTRPELRKYGYAPGHYMIQCAVGAHTATDCDKRAFCCLACAEAKLTKENGGGNDPVPAEALL